MKRIVLFVEGEGESDAAPILVKRLLTEQNAWDAVFLDENAFRALQVPSAGVGQIDGNLDVGFRFGHVASRCAIPQVARCCPMRRVGS